MAPEDPLAAAKAQRLLDAENMVNQKKKRDRRKKQGGKARPGQRRR